MAHWNGALSLVATPEVIVGGSGIAPCIGVEGGSPSKPSHIGCNQYCHESKNKHRKQVVRKVNIPEEHVAAKMEMTLAAKPSKNVDNVDMCHRREALFLGWGRSCATPSVLAAQFQDATATDKIGRSDENSRGSKGEEQFTLSKQDMLLVKVYPSRAVMMII